MHNGGNHFGQYHNGAHHFMTFAVGLPPEASDPGTGNVSVTWRNRPNTALDYWIISANDTLIAGGSTTTNESGVMSVDIPTSYAGQYVLVVVNNLGEDMSTIGKVQGQQVVLVS